MNRVSHEQNDPSWEFEDDELEQLQAIANVPMEYYLEIAATGEEQNDYGLRSKINEIAQRSEYELCNDTELLGEKPKPSWKGLKRKSGGPVSVSDHVRDGRIEPW
jgi:hypothetical protein